MRNVINFSEWKNPFEKEYRDYVNELIRINKSIYLNALNECKSFEDFRICLEIFSQRHVVNIIRTDDYNHPTEEILEFINSGLFYQICNQIVLDILSLPVIKQRVTYKFSEYK